MGRWRTEHYYTCKGRRRAVFLRPEGGRARFGLEVADGDEACVEVSFDIVEHIKRGQGAWEVHEGCGDVAGATALRVHVKAVTGWVKLIVEEETDNG